MRCWGATRVVRSPPMVRTAFIVLLIAYLPGALIFRLPVAERSRRAALSAEERVFWGSRHQPRALFHRCVRARRDR